MLEAIGQVLGDPSFKTGTPEATEARDAAVSLFAWQQQESSSLVGVSEGILSQPTESGCGKNSSLCGLLSDSAVEKYKQLQHKSTQRSKSLRKTLHPNNNQ